MSYNVTTLDGNGRKITHMGVPAEKIANGLFLGYRTPRPILAMVAVALPGHDAVTCGGRYNCD